MSTDLDDYIARTFDQALESGYIQPFYQPVIRSISNKLCSFEALARWIDPKRGMISPGSFIPVLERMEKIHLLDIHIIRQVCARIRRSVDAGETPVPVSVNLSRLDFELCDIFAEVMDAVSTYQIPRSFLYIEITESLVAERGSAMRKEIDRFRAAGFQVWMDDFGSGYSSLNVLKEFSFDEIKLDMGFLSSFDHRSRRIMASIVQMAKGLGMHTLTEDVETAEQVSYMHNIGCEKLQGFFFGKPAPYEESLAHMAAQGIEIETPVERGYYDDIGKVDFLSAVPFMTQGEKESLATARQLNSIPLALAEARRDSFSVLFYNSALEDTARGTGMIGNIFSQETLRKPRPYSLLPKRVISLMDSTRSGHEGRMFFISNEEYYEIRAKCVAQTREAHCVLFSMSNLSKASEVEKTSRLDEGLRQIYSLYERIALLDAETDSLLPLYVGTREDVVSGRSNLRRLSREYCERLIYPEDRKEYLEFVDLDTLDDRLRASGKLGITKMLRTRTAHGRYEWKAYTLLKLQEHTYLELIRNVQDDVLAFISRDAFVAQGTGDASTKDALEECVWRALLNSNLVNLFWKDGDRRFLGASKGFLDYYGFSSVADIFGKNDEELGWHVQPGAYKNDELDVICEGMTTQYEPGHCMRGGENRDIYASKIPLYDSNGDICGLVGHFIDKDMLTANDSRGDETKRRDLLTGLLNSRGIHEEACIFRDEYFLRGTDFIHIDVSLDDINTINNQYGYDFGDKTIVRLGEELRRCFGQSAVVGRRSGHELVVLCQIHDKEEEARLREKAKGVAENIRQIDGTPLTLYVSVGSCCFSETETLEEQSKKAEMRQLADHDGHITAENRMIRAQEIFHLYDNLPISYSVYKVLVDEGNRVYDAVLFYVNHSFEQRMGAKAVDILGKGTRELFESLPDDWYDKAYRAAYQGEIITDRFYFGPTDKTYFMTASPVIHSGYCCFTYQEIDG